MSSTTISSASALPLSPGDRLSVSIPNEKYFARTYEVNQNGELEIPLLGEVTVAGLEPIEVDLKAEQEGLLGQMATLKAQISRLENELTILAQKEVVLDTLDRDLQIAQAVFASTLTKIDLSKGDPFADTVGESNIG
ncbi:MAG: polysaccharide biosynthesis/export family protein [Xenococcaceae cyanobacterium MO_234.B1]|nr:polysaccharide biosynthesis/export family protein [Xenococcaceae cyanobacterium MO_234.B1]